MRISLSRLLTTTAAVGVMLATAPSCYPQGGPEATPVLARVIADRELWGDDGIAAIRAAAAWRGMVKRYLVVFPQQVVADQPMADPADPAPVKGLTDRTNQAAKARPPGAKPAPPDDALARAATFRVEVARMRDDDSRRLAWTREGAVFLKTGPRLSDIEARYGKPQRVLSETIDTRGERRPAVLTIYEYDGGAVRFAASDLSSLPPGTVDRVFLDLAAVERVIAAEG